MDSERFDFIAKAMGGHGRRQVLSGLLGGVLAVSGLTGIETGARKGAADGLLGGRHSKNRRGRDRDRRRDRDRKDRVKENRAQPFDEPSAVVSPINLRDCSNAAFVPHADLSYCRLDEMDLADRDLTGADLTSAHLSRTNLDRSLLIDAKLDKATLDDTRLYKANLSGANLVGAHVDRVYMQRASLVGANLSGAFFWPKDIIAADLTDANLSGATVPRPHELDNAILCRTIMPNGEQRNIDCD